MKSFEDLKQGYLEQWLLGKGMSKEFLAHAVFKEGGLLNYLLSLAGISFSEEEKPLIEVSEREGDIKIEVGTNSWDKTNKGVTFEVIGDTLKVSSWIVNKPNANDKEEYKEYREIRLNRLENAAMHVNTSRVRMDKSRLTIEGLTNDQHFDENGIEFHHNIVLSDNDSFLEGRSPEEKGKERERIADALATRQDAIVERENKSYREFMQLYNTNGNILRRLNDRGFVEYESEYVKRTQFDVANVQLKFNRSHFYPDRSDLSYSGDMPLNTEHLSVLRPEFSLRRLEERDLAYFRRPTINPLSEEEIKSIIERTICSPEQKKALFDMAIDSNRISYAYNPVISKYNETNSSFGRGRM